MTDWKTIDNDREKYAAYLCSREWAEKREAVHQRAGGRCERCGAFDIDAVHHLTYARKYDELLEDLQGHCKWCHGFTHGKHDFDPVSVVLGCGMTVAKAAQQLDHSDPVELPGISGDFQIDAQDLSVTVGRALRLTGAIRSHAIRVGREPLVAALDAYALDTYEDTILKLIMELQRARQGIQVEGV
jgi:hypothetical protein